MYWLEAALILIFGGLVDHISTLLLLKKYPLEWELNPLIKWIYNEWGERGIVGTYLLSTFAALTLLYIFRNIENFNEFIFLLGMIRLAIGIWNIMLLIYYGFES